MIRKYQRYSLVILSFWGKLIPQANFLSHFFEGNHNGKFEVRVKMIDGADNVFSLRRKELF